MRAFLTHVCYPDGLMIGPNIIMNNRPQRELILIPRGMQRHLTRNIDSLGTRFVPNKAWRLRLRDIPMFSVEMVLSLRKGRLALRVGATRVICHRDTRVAENA